MPMDGGLEAVLLLGPTGSGKTPLGDLFEQRGCPLPGLRGKDCIHFDFGANLRSLVERDVAEDGITREDLTFIRRVLEDGVLLEDEHFPLARRVFQAFLRHRASEISGRVSDTGLIVLNGLPRHVGQAQAVDTIVEVVAIINLQCDESSVAARIVENVGGDRLGRTDDDMAAVGRKLLIYKQRTAPLVLYYQTRGATMLSISVDAKTTPEDVWDLVERGGSVA